jgi:hypothetical protein
MTYTTSSATRKPPEVIALSTGSDPEGWRLWWAHETKREGTDWASLGRAAARVYWRLGLTSSLAWVSSS